jgi:hypothetical protein
MYYLDTSPETTLQKLKNFEGSYYPWWMIAGWSLVGTVPGALIGLLTYASVGFSATPFIIGGIAAIVGIILAIVKCLNHNAKVDLEERPYLATFQNTPGQLREAGLDRLAKVATDLAAERSESLNIVTPQIPQLSAASPTTTTSESRGQQGLTQTSTTEPPTTNSPSNDDSDHLKKQ